MHGWGHKGGRNVSTKDAVCADGGADAEDTGSAGVVGAGGAVGTSEVAAARDAAAAPGDAGAASKDALKRIDIISDTHGHLSGALLSQLEGADLIIHAGDITSETDWEHLCTIAPIKGVLGNNDYYRDYGPEVTRLARFSYAGLRFAVAHYREDLPVDEVDVAVCGHTHRARIAEEGNCLVVNPGSPTFPRGMRGATMVRMMVAQGRICSVKIIDLK